MKDPLLSNTHDRSVNFKAPTVDDSEPGITILPKIGGERARLATAKFADRVETGRGMPPGDECFYLWPIGARRTAR